MRLSIGLLWHRILFLFCKVAYRILLPTKRRLFKGGYRLRARRPEYSRSRAALRTIVPLQPIIPSPWDWRAITLANNTNSFNEIDSWTVNGDLSVALGKYVGISGEWYRGEAASGLGGRYLDERSLSGNPPRHMPQSILFVPLEDGRS